MNLQFVIPMDQVDSLSAHFSDCDQFTQSGPQVYLMKIYMYVLKMLRTVSKSKWFLENFIGVLKVMKKLQ